MIEENQQKASKSCQMNFRMEKKVWESAISNPFFTQMTYFTEIFIPDQ